MKRHTRVSFLLPDAAWGVRDAPLSSFLACVSVGGAALSSLGLDGVSVFDGAGGVGDVSRFGALVSA